MSAHLVIAEDEPMIGRILEHKLVREGHAVVWVRDAESLRAALLGGDVDVALVDATLECDGLALMASLGLAPRCGWLALVEQRDGAAQRRAVECGAAAVVLKPFKPTAVAAVVADLLRRAAV
jgi:DNA-binding response OmpR family regulator